MTSIFTAQAGEVHWRGVWMPRSSTKALLDLYEREAADGADYFQRDAKRLADELRQAMAQAYESEPA